MITLVKINNFLKENVFSIIKWFLILSPIVDFLAINQNNAMCVILFKIIFLLILLLYGILNRFFKNKKIIIYTFLVIMYLFLNLTVVNNINLVVFNVMFLPLSFMFIYFIYKEKKEVIGERNLRLIMFIYVCLFLVSTFLDNNNIFINELSIVISIMLPLLFYFAFNKFKYYKMLILIITIIMCLIIKSLLPLVLLGILIVTFLFKELYVLIKDKKYGMFILNLILGLTLITFSVIVILNTDYYNGIKSFIGFDDVNFSNDFVQILFGSFSENSNYSLINFVGLLNSIGIIGFLIFVMPFLLLLNEVKFFDKWYFLSLVMALFSLVFINGFFSFSSLSILSVIILCNAFFKKQAKKKVAIASYNLGYGGIETSLVSLLKNLDYDKLNVTLYLESKEGVFLKEVSKLVKIKEYKPFDINNKFIRKGLNLIKKIMFLIINKNEYDSSITFATYSMPCVFIGLNASLNTMLYVHSNYKHAYQNDEKKIRCFFDMRKIKKFDHVVFVSNESKKDLIKFYPSIEKRSITISNLVDYEKIISLSEETIDVPKDDKTIILFVGRLEETAKKITRILRVAKRFKKDKSLVFWIVGDGPNKKDYEKIIKEEKLSNVVMFGAKKNPYPFIKACNYVIITSDYEGFPVVYNEAIVLNKTILTTIDVSDDYITIPNRFGILMKKDEQDIYEKIKYALDNKVTFKEKIDFNKLNKNRLKMLYDLMEVNHD